MTIKWNLPFVVMDKHYTDVIRFGEAIAHSSPCVKLLHVLGKDLGWTPFFKRHISVMSKADLFAPCDLDMYPDVSYQGELSEIGQSLLFSHTDHWNSMLVNRS